MDLRTSLRISLALALTSTLLACQHGGPIPEWHGQIWAGDSAKGAIVRAQSNQVIPALDPEFDKYMAMTYSDFRQLYATYVLGCKQWRRGVNMMSPEEALSRFRIAFKDLEDEARANAEADAQAKEQKAE